MASNKRDFYSISVETLHTLLWVGGLAGLVIGGALLFHSWSSYAREHRASVAIESSRALLERLRTSDSLASQSSVYDESRRAVSSAQEAFNRGAFDEAYDLADSSRRALRDALGTSDQRGIAEFSQVEGDVQYRRSNSGDFQRARSRQTLYPGDYIRTSSKSTAEIIFHGIQTPMVVGPQALIQLPRGGNGASNSASVGLLEYGWVRLNTKEHPGEVRTKDSQVTVAGNSRATVSWDRLNDRGNVRVSRGRASVSASSGEVVELDALEQVDQVGGLLDQPLRLVAEPTLEQPPDRFAFDLSRETQVKLSWKPVKSANRYALEIAGNPLFNDPVVQDERRDTWATVGLRAERTFYWRVAAVDPAGIRGTWSDPRVFRATATSAEPTTVDLEPPELAVRRPLISGDVVILEGQTEPGAQLAVNTHAIDVRVDGTFREIVEARALRKRSRTDGDGYVVLAFRATDAAGNVAINRQHRIKLALN